MESGAIKDSQINASSETENGTRDQSRLNSGPEKAWCVQESDSVRTFNYQSQKAVLHYSGKSLNRKITTPWETNVGGIKYAEKDRWPRWEGVRGVVGERVRHVIKPYSAG